ncbi:hypothetical protein MFLO_05590 [Listeria floridensis FSL S10-1187]|uniref:Uncharacterized protein n=1 Tax=Listeria floridensis FSL S10-1187 TaxID=1265817 RepID=A0ABN0RGK9_9LIST|nr:hypothetical protein MFLO_05590 [Listeria floridensis FSL S10-1187]
MSKIVFFDVDGTLVDEKKEIPESTRKAIQSLKRKRNLCGNCNRACPVYA